MKQTLAGAGPGHGHRGRYSSAGQITKGRSHRAGRVLEASPVSMPETARRAAARYESPRSATEHAQRYLYRHAFSAEPWTNQPWHS